MRHSLYFSIVIPVRNEKDVILRTLQIVCAQLYKNFEIIVVDNGSNDTTVEIVQNFAKKDRRVTVVSCPIGGLLHARDAGYRAAKGDVVVQLDANARPLNRDWLTRAVVHLEEDEGTIALAGPYDYYDATWFFRWKTLCTLRLFLPVTNWFVQRFRWKGYINGAFIIGGNAFIRKWVLDEMKGYPVTETDFFFEDAITGRAIAQYGWVASCYDLIVAKSARRYKKFGYKNTQAKYSQGIKAVLCGRPFPPIPTVELNQ